MNCSRCRKKIAESSARCPHCGQPNAKTSGVFQTSTVLISAGGSDLVYRSVDEVPVHLRTKLLRTTNSSNSATILIADRRGRKEVVKAMRNLPGPTQRRLMHSMLGEEDPSKLRAWISPARRKAILALLLIVTLLVIGIVFNYRW